MTVGKVIQFKILYSIPTGTKRDYGIIHLSSGESFPDAAVAEGLVKLREDAGRKDESEASKALFEKLKFAEASAKAGSKGVWASSGGKIEIAHEIPDPKDFVEQYKDKPIVGIVERVLTGDRMIVRLCLSPNKHLQTMVLVAGIRAPATKRTNPSDGKEQPAEPFGSQAHDFVESRLLQRNVEIGVLGLSPQGILVCTVEHPLGNIAKYLLEAGLARCTDFHSTMLGGQMSVLRQAEKQAKDRKLGLFQGLTNDMQGASETDATVTRIQTADTVYLRDKSGEEKRVSLSSVRQPKPTDPKQAPFQAEAKEFLRKKLIGKHVRVTVDGKKAATEGFEERDVVTVIINNKNIALQLVEAGYASVIRHRRDDGEECALHSQDLCLRLLQRTEAQLTTSFWPQKKLPKEMGEGSGLRNLLLLKRIKTTQRACKKQGSNRRSSNARRKYQQLSISSKPAPDLPSSFLEKTPNSHSCSLAFKHFVQPAMQTKNLTPSDRRLMTSQTDGAFNETSRSMSRL